MAQTQDEIYAALQTDANSRASLAPIVNGSATGRLKMLWQGVAYIARQVQLLWDNFKAEIQLIVAAGEPLTNAWYQQKFLEFQYGDSLTIVNGVPVYATIDTTKRIIVYASCADNRISGQIVAKVAKNAGGVITQLTSGELTAFTSYVNEIQGAGDRISIASLAADTLRVAGTIWYDGQIPLATIQANVLAAIQAALVPQLTNDPVTGAIKFNGTLQQIKIEEAIAAVTGVNDLGLTYTAFQGSGSPTPWIGRYPTVSGYISLDTAGGHSLTDLVTFISE